MFTEAYQRLAVGFAVRFCGNFVSLAIAKSAMTR